MMYDGFLVVVNEESAVRMMFFRTTQAADRFIKENPGRLGGWRPAVQGFVFADFLSVPLVE